MKKIILSSILMSSAFLAISCSNNNANTTTSNRKLSIAAPSGAPLVAISDAIDDTFETQFNLSAEALGKLFGKNEVDMIVAPVNLGAKVYNGGAKNYKLASVLTWGNLYFASQKADFDNIDDLNNQKLTFFGQGTINQAVTDYVLSNYNITPLGDITYLGNTSLTQSELLTKEDSIVLIAEPALSAAKKQNANVKAISVQELFEAKSNNKFTQAGCFVRIKTTQEDKKLIDNALTKIKTSCDLAKTNATALAEKANSLGIETPKAVLASSIPGCNINYAKAVDVKGNVEFSANLALNLFGDKLPDNDFYYA